MLSFLDNGSSGIGKNNIQTMGLSLVIKALDLRDCVLKKPVNWTIKCF